MSDKPKWTPGPWKAIGVGIYVDDAEDREIRAIASTGLSRPSKENLANARLIAAAPQMAEALRPIALRCCEDDSDGGCSACEPCVARAALRAAGVEP